MHVYILYNSILHQQFEIYAICYIISDWSSFQLQIKLWQINCKGNLPTQISLFYRCNILHHQVLKTACFRYYPVTFNVIPDYNL